MTESRELRTMRHMAWERAKGELGSMLATFWDNGDRHEELAEAVEHFIKTIQDNGMHE